MILGKHILNGSSGPSIPVGEKWTFTSNTTFEVPANGNYKITLVGGGGQGGTGGTYYHQTTYCSGSCTAKKSGGGGGGGGGAGETIITTTSIKRNTKLTITIGSSTISSSIPELSITARAGGNGGNARCSDKHCYLGGVAGTSYGTAAQAGTNGGYETETGSGTVTVTADVTGGVGGNGGLSTYGNNIGKGGKGSNGASSAYYPSSGGAGTAGICVIEYMGR